MYVSISLTICTSKGVSTLACAYMFRSAYISVHAYVCFYWSVYLYIEMCINISVSLSVYLSVHADVSFYYFVCLSIMSIDGHVCFYPSVCLYMHMYGSISQCHEKCFTKLHSKATSLDSNELVHQSSLARAFSVRPNVI